MPDYGRGREADALSPIVSDKGDCRIWPDIASKTRTPNTGDGGASDFPKEWSRNIWSRIVVSQETGGSAAGGMLYYT